MKCGSVYLMQTKIKWLACSSVCFATEMLHLFVNLLLVRTIKATLESESY